MDKFCRHCGAKLRENAKFCGGCGMKTENVALSEEKKVEVRPEAKVETKTEVKPETKPEVKSETKPEVEPAIKKESEQKTEVKNIYKAAASFGEQSFLQIPPGLKQVGNLSTATLTDVAATLSPIKVIFGGIKGYFRGFKNIFKDKKTLIKLILLIVVWTVLLILPARGFNPLPMKVLTLITFAQGGVGNTGAAVLGGVIGKSVVACFIFNLFKRRKQKAGKGALKEMFSSMFCKKIDEFKLFLPGFGLALISYNFMVGTISIVKIMAAFAAMSVTIQTVKNENAFLARLLGSFTARKTGKINYQKVNRIRAGITAGFAAAIPLTLLQIGNLGYTIGFFALALEVVLCILDIVMKNKKRAVAATILMYLFASIAIPCGVLVKAASDSYNPDYNYDKYDYSVTSRDTSWSEYITNDEDAPGNASEGDDYTYVYVTKSKKGEDDYTKSVTDKIYIKFFNIPSNEAVKFSSTDVPIYTEGKTETFEATCKTMLKIGNMFNGVGSISGISRANTWEKYKEELTGFKDTTFWGRPAIIREGDWETTIYVHFDDISLPDGNSIILPLVVKVDPLNLNMFTSLNYEMVAGTEAGSKYLENMKGKAKSQIDNGIKKLESVKIEIAINDDSILNASYSGAAAKEIGEKAVDIPNAIAIGVVSAVASAGAVGAVAAATAGSSAGAVAGGIDGSTSDNTKKSKVDKKLSSYKLVIKKDFSDRIRYGADEVELAVRIVEVTEEGSEKSRPDLAGCISIESGSSAIITSTCITDGEYRCANVYAQRDASLSQNPDFGVVTISYMGGSCFFKNDITFKLIEDAEVIFENQDFDMVLGDKGNYIMNFEIKDYIGTLENVKAKVSDDSLIGCELREVSEGQYELKLTNKSQEPEKDSKEINCTIEITADDVLGTKKVAVSGSNKVTMRMPGFSIRSINLDDNGYGIVNCGMSTNGKFAGEIPPTVFRVNLLVSKTVNGITNAKIIDSTEYDITFDAMSSNIEELKNLDENYKIKIEADEMNGLRRYLLQPEKVLPHPPGTDYFVYIPMKTVYEGKEYTNNFELSLIGDKPPEIDTKAVELERLKRIAGYYDVLQDEIDKIMQNVNNYSAMDLRLMNIGLLHEGKYYYEGQSRYYSNVAMACDYMIDGLSVVKWIGDQAFVLLMQKFVGPGEAFITPAKEVLVDIIGEASACFLFGKQFDYSSLNVYKAAGNALEKYLATKLKAENVTQMTPQEIKKIIGIVSTYLVISAVKHYFTDVDPVTKEQKYDLYGSIVGAFADLSSRAVKVICGTYLKSFVNSEAGQKFVGSTVMKYLSEKLPEGELVNISGEALTLAGIDVANRYISELFGLGAAKLVRYSSENNSKKTSSGSSPDMSGWSRIQISGEVYFTYSPEKTLDKVTELVWEKTLGAITYLDIKITIPKEPVYYRDAGKL